MDLSYSKEEVAFRQEVRDFFKTSVPAETRKKLTEGRHLSKQDMVDVAAHPQQEGLGRSALAEAVGRHRLGRGEALHLQ